MNRRARFAWTISARRVRARKDNMVKKVVYYKEGWAERREGFFGSVCPYVKCAHVQVACLHTGAGDHRVSKDKNIRCNGCGRTYTVKKEQAA